MKVRALKNTRHKGKLYLIGQEFSHEDPKAAIAAKIVEPVEGGKK